MAFYFYLSTKIIMVFITKSYQDLFGVRSYINANAFAAAKTMCSFTTVLSVLFFLTLFILNIKGNKDTLIL